MKCADCKWWDRRYRVQCNFSEYVYSDCRRYPQSFEKREDEYCGEFSEKETTEK